MKTKLFGTAEMMILKLLCFSLVCAVVDSSITAADVRSVRNAVRVLESKKKQLQREIAGLAKDQDRWESNMDKGLARIRKAQQDTEKQINKREEGFDKYMKAISDRYIRSRENRFKIWARKTYREELKVQRKEIDGIAKTQNSFIKNFRSEISKIRNSNNRIARETKNKIESFGEEANAAADKLSSQGALENLGDELYLLSRQVQLQQFNEYEKARSDGNTGIKQIHTLHVGDENYYSEDYSNRGVAGIYDKEYTKNKLGIGEFFAVMNGIEFKTGSHDYELRQPSKTQNTFHQTEPIQFPSPPDSVKSKTDVFEQIIEMRKLFKSFQYGDDDESVMNNFQPVLSYLEGAWLFGSGESNTEECQYNSYVGRKKYTKPYLPTSILGFTADKKPQYATWDYRILAHKLKNYVSPSLLKPIFDPASLRRHKWRNSMNQATQRYDLFGVEKDGRRRHRPIYYSYVDSLMEQIPGKDNYVGSLQATGYEATITSANDQKSLNGAFYHRVYKLESIDAMGVRFAQKSFSDVLYVAESSHENVAGLSYTNDKKEKTLVNASYAMPMEIIYLTPLTEWNPFEIPHEDDCDQVNGDGSAEHPFDATCPDRFFRTPQAFFSGANHFDCVDSWEDSFYFRSPKSTYPPVCLVGSGVRRSLPPIHSIYGRVRQRYPIMPVNGEGSSVWKKLNAIEDNLVFLNVVDEEYEIRTGESTHSHIETHTHTIVLTKAEVGRIFNGESITKLTEPEEGQHQHILVLGSLVVDEVQRIVIASCDTDSGDGNADTFCFDNHHKLFQNIVKY